MYPPTAIDIWRFPQTSGREAPLEHRFSNPKADSFLSSPLAGEGTTWSTNQEGIDDCTGALVLHGSDLWPYMHMERWVGPA